MKTYKETHLDSLYYSSGLMCPLPQVTIGLAARKKKKRKKEGGSERFYWFVVTVNK